MEEYEAAANITFSIDGVEIPVQSVDLSKDVEIEQIRENNLKAIGYSVTEIDYSGTISFTGNGYITEIDDVAVNTNTGTNENGEETDQTIDDLSASHLEDFFTDDEGIPKDGANVTIYHDNDAKQTSYEDVMVTSDGYETETSDMSGVTFDVIARNRTREDIPEN